MKTLLTFLVMFACMAASLYFFCQHDGSSVLCRDVNAYAVIAKRESLATFNDVQAKVLAVYNDAFPPAP